MFGRAALNKDFRFFPGYRPFDGINRFYPLIPYLKGFLIGKFLIAGKGIAFTPPPAALLISALSILHPASRFPPKVPMLAHMANLLFDIRNLLLTYLPSFKIRQPTPVSGQAAYF